MEKWNRSIISVDPKIYLITSVALLAFSFRWVYSWMFAVFIHELGHYLAVVFCRRNILSVRIGLTGVLMESDILKPMESVLCSLAGPMASAVLVLFHGCFPRLAICGFFQAIYNLLPLTQLDGGQVLKTIASCVFGEMCAIKIISVIEWLLLSALFVLCFYMTVVFNVGLFPLVFFILFLMKYQKIKIPCKAWRHRVQ